MLTIPYTIKDVFDERRRITRFRICPRTITSEGRREKTVKARGEMLKFAVKREQSQACLRYAEREQIELR